MPVGAAPLKKKSRPKLSSASRALIMMIGLLIIMITLILILPLLIIKIVMPGVTKEKKKTEDESDRIHQLK